MKKDEIIEGIMKAAGISKANINRFYEGLINLAKKKLEQDGEFALPGLGVLRVKVRKARTGRHPKTGEKITIPRRKVIRFGAFKELKELLNEEDLEADVEEKKS
jgi:nucleoid DNA-binding protein